ncbi:unnamed protein product [Adineta ricciae]|uniref:Uncharacterized protein n=1 Tax=Adineta ricciae TaxID=249248 RepID=A0A814FM91_ADIRI|nr:unnamed protein product [Adineta ricciae]
MACCIIDVRNNRYLPKALASTTQNLETDHFVYNHETNSIDCKLLSNNIYHRFFQHVYPDTILEHELTNDMLDVIKSYTNSRTNDCYMKTNLNLLSAHFDDIDWVYVNKLRSLIRALVQTNIKSTYYRGLQLSNTEIRYYIERKGSYYYTNSFLSFTIDRLLVYDGNAILILNTERSGEKAKRNLANIWKWSSYSEEKEALLCVGAKLRIVSVHYYGCRWEIEVELIEDSEN